MAVDFFDPFTQYGEQAASAGIPYDIPAAMRNNGWQYFSANVAGPRYYSIGAAYSRFAGDRGFSIDDEYGNGTSFTYIAYANQATELFAFPFNCQAIGDGQVIFSVNDGTSTQVDFRYALGGYIQITRNGTLLATSAAPALFTGIWYSVEITATIDSTAGFIEWKQNGTSVVSFTGNTQHTGNAYSNVAGFGSYNFGDINVLTHKYHLGHFIAFNPTGAAPTAYMGDKRFYPIYPASAGDLTQFANNFASWVGTTATVLGQQIEDSNGNVQQVVVVAGDAKTGGSTPTWSTSLNGTTVDNHVTWMCVAKPAANWNAVTEAPPDGDSSYNSSSTVGNVDRFSGTAAPATMTGIIGIAPIICSRKDDAGTRSMQLTIKSGSTAADSGVDQVQGSTYAYYGMGANGVPALFTIDPSTGVAWVVGGVNAVKFGYKVTA